MDVFRVQIIFFFRVFFECPTFYKVSIEAVFKNSYTYRRYNYPCHTEQVSGTCFNILNTTFLKQYILSGCLKYIGNWVNLFLLMKTYIYISSILDRCFLKIYLFFFFFINKTRFFFCLKHTYNLSILLKMQS